MKVAIFTVVSSLLSLSAFAEKIPCTVFLSGGQSAAWVEDQASEQLSDSGCTVVKSAENAKYSITWSYEQANCYQTGRPNPVLARIGAALTGSRGVSVVLKSADGSLSESVHKSIYAPSLHGDTCNIMNGHVNRGTAKIINGFVSEIEAAESAQN